MNALKIAAAGIGLGSLASAPVAAQSITPTSFGANGEPNPLMWTIEGGAIFSQASAHFSDGIEEIGKLGLDTDVGGYGAISVGRYFEPDIDWRLTGRFGKFARNSSLATGEDNFLNFDDVFDDDDFLGVDEYEGFLNTNREFATIDFDIGHHFEKPGLAGRAFVGLRGLYSRESLGKGIYVAGTPDPDVLEEFALGGSYSSEFFGAGPRAGLELLFRDGDSPFGIAVDGSAAVLFGNTRERFRVGGAYCETIEQGEPDCDGDSETFTRNEFDIVGNIAASIGVQFDVNENSSITVGVKGETWTHSLFSDSSAMYGPFVKAGVKF